VLRPADRGLPCGLAVRSLAAKKVGYSIEMWQLIQSHRR